MFQAARNARRTAPRIRFQPTKPTSILAALMVSLGLSVSAWAADYDEVIDGDFSNDPANPTPLAVDAGSNVLTGDVTDTPLDLDIFTLNVPEGLEVTEIVLSRFELVSSPFDGGMLVALEEGPQITDLNSGDALRGFVIAGVSPGTEEGDDLLDDMGGAPLSAGQWTLWIQNTGSVTDYQLTVTAASAAPPPGGGPVGAATPVPTLDSLGLLVLLLAMGLVAVRALRSGD